MNNLGKMFFAAAAGLFAMSLMVNSTQSTLSYLDSLSGRPIVPHHASVPMAEAKGYVLGITTAPTVTIKSPGDKAVLAAGTTSTELDATTDTVADCRFSSSSTDPFPLMIQFTNTATTTHSTMLSPLANGNAYTVYVKCQDSNGNTSNSASVYFSVDVPKIVADNTPPVISKISITSIGANSATITWNTDEVADTQIEYGPITAYGSFTPLSDTGKNMTTSHTATITGLNFSYTFHFRVRSKDASGNLSFSEDNVVTTTIPPYGSAPTATYGNPQTTSGDILILQPHADFIKPTSATIYWSTDISSYGQIKFGKTSDYGTSTGVSGLLVTNHGMDLTGLDPASTYHYQIIATDLYSHKGTSSDGWFTTQSTSTAQSTVPVNSAPVQAPAQPIIPASQLVRPSIVLPANVKDGDILKFKKSSAVYLVKPDGLYPFESMAALKRYQKQSRKKIKTINRTVDPFTVVQIPASLVLGY